VQQVEMLFELPRAEKIRPWTKFLPNIFLILALLANARIAKSQSSEIVATDGKICGTVLLKADHRPASQVAVRLKSHVAGIFRSILTDVEGHFEVRGLPRGTYEIVVDEPGYESTPTNAQVDAPSTELVIYISSSHLAETLRNRETISVRELQIPGKARDEDQKGLERLAKNDPAGSLSHFRKATQAAPGYYEAHCHIGVVEMKLGHSDEAMQAYQTAIDLSAGRYALAEFGLGYLLYLEGKPGEAEEILRRGLEVDESSAYGYAILGMTRLQLDRADEAEKSAREAILREPGIGLAYLVLADVHARKGLYWMQLRELDTYLKLDPSGPTHERVKQAREEVQRMLAQARAQD
jgi:tetratricopeptide (TPR) repeat protein